MTQSYDYIIVGAGAAGPVIASRLSEDETKSVLLLEAGGENTNELSRAPGAFFGVWKTDYDWQYETTAQDGLNKRKIYQPRGHVVGGSTAINVGFWMRGSKEDYDYIEEQGAEGWNYNKALELFQKIEDTNKGPSKYRGKGGMVHLEDSAYPDTDFVDKMLTAFTEADFGSIGDFNAENPYQASIVQKDYINNVRHTPADSYLSPDIRKRKNLTIIPNAFVQKVTFDGNKANGVIVEISGSVEEINANKEIILSAGAYNTPQILKLSGVGPKEELEKFNIPVVADVQGVGENLNDHLSISMSIISDKDIPNTKVKNPLSPESLEMWKKEHKGPSTYFAPAAGLVSSDKSYTGPDFEFILGYQNTASGNELEFKDIENLKEKSGYSVSVVLMTPESRGSVTLQSANPHDKVLINPNYFKDGTTDLARFIKGIRYAQTITQTPTLADYSSAISPSMDATDAELETFLRTTATTVFHPVGTARVGDLTNDPMAVVDKNLKVKNVEGLRVADASILPKVNRGHTMAPTVFVGEFAAQLIKNNQ